MLALAVGDVGHLLATGSVLGWSAVLDVRRWSWVTVGNLAVTAGLLGARVAFLVGWLGTRRERGRGMGKRG